MKLNELLARLRKPYACLELCGEISAEKEREGGGRGRRGRRDREGDCYRRSFARAGTQETRDLIIARK